MENRLGKKELEGILNMLRMKQQFLESCAKDYEVQIKQVEMMLADLEAQPTVKVEEKPAEKNEK